MNRVSALRFYKVCEDACLEQLKSPCYVLLRRTLRAVCSFAKETQVIPCAFYLFTAAKACALCLRTAAGVPTGNADMLRTALFILIKRTVARLARHVIHFGNAFCRVGGFAASALLKAAAAGLMGAFCLFSLHHDIALTAAVILIINTSGHGTV